MELVPSGGNDQWPFVGRRRELELIASTYAERAGRPGAAMMLIGAAGVGKTRLAVEAARRLAGRGGPATCEGPSGPEGIIVVDDAHLLDDRSAAALCQLAIGGRVFVLLTVRAGEPAPEAVTALWTTGTASRLDVNALPDEEIGALLASAVAGPVDAISDREVRRLCAGNPRMLREILLAGQETGTLRQVRGLWQWTGGNYVTSRLVDGVRAGLTGLAPPLVELAELVASAEPLGVPVLERLSGHDTVVEAERRALITVDYSGARMLARFTEPVYADVVRALTPRVRQRRIWCLLAQALESTPLRRVDDVLLLALWRHRAGLETPVEPTLVAATRAAQRLDLDPAERLARLALAAGAGPPAALLLAEVLTYRGRYADAAEVLPPDPELLDEQSRGRWSVVARLAGHPGAARPRPPGDEQPGQVGAVPRDPDAVAAHAWLLVADGNMTQALHTALGVLAAAPAGCPPATPGSSGRATTPAAVSAAPAAGVDTELSIAAANWAAAGAIASAGLLGRSRSVQEMLSRALAQAHRHDAEVPWGPAPVSIAGCLALLATGHLLAARKLADDCSRHFIDLAGGLGPGAAPVVGACLGVCGVVARAQGRGKAALAALTEAAMLLDGWSAFRLDRLYLAELAATYAMLGNPDTAAERIAEADGRNDVPVPLVDVWVERARSWVLAAHGDLTRAADQAAHAGALARATQQPTIEALALLDVARFGAPRRAYPRLAELAADLGLGTVAAMACVAGALRTGDGADDLDRAAATLARYGHTLHAAEAAASAYTRHARAGRRAQASRSLLRAKTLADECDGARTPLLALDGVGILLTSRELQVARLAAAGKSAPAIAACLGLSPRTVNNHLARAYDKLGARGRDELRAVLTDG